MEVRNEHICTLRTFILRDQQLQKWRRWEKLKFYPTEVTYVKFFVTDNFSTNINKNNNNH